MWFESNFLNCGVLLGLVGILLYIYIKISFSYWHKRGVPCINTKSPLEIAINILSGKKSVSEIYEDVYNDLAGHKFGGVYQMLTPTLVLRDPEMIKRVMLKDFDHFHTRVLYFKEEKDPLAANLFTVGGLRWKKMRTMLSPGFTPTKMRQMCNAILEITTEMVRHIDNVGEEVEIKALFARFTMDVIASTAFGITTNCLHDPENEFQKWGKKVFEPTALTGIRNMINFMIPKLASIIYIPFFSKAVTDHFCHLVWETADYRTKNNIQRNDFMQVLMQLHDKGYVEGDDDGDEAAAKRQMENAAEKMSTKEMAAQAVIFFTAGFETSATSLSFCCHELGVNPDIQSKVRDEVLNVIKKYNGEITYDGLQEMTYMDMVVSESLRKYPPGAILTRNCCENFVLPGTNIVLEKGTPVVIPVLGLHRDPQYFPDPENFDPERFSEVNKQRRSPYVYLPFGEGPRNCVASRFAIMEMKMAMAALLKNYDIQMCPQTKHPITFDPRAFVLCSVGGMWLKFVKRNYVS